MAPVAIGVHLAVRGKRPAQAGQDERREGESLACAGFVLADDLARPGDIELHQPMHRVALAPHPPAVYHRQPDARKRRRLKRVVIGVHLPDSFQPPSDAARQRPMIFTAFAAPSSRRMAAPQAWARSRMAGSVVARLMAWASRSQVCSFAVAVLQFIVCDIITHDV